MVAPPLFVLSASVALAQALGGRSSREGRSSLQVRQDRFGVAPAPPLRTCAANSSVPVLRLCRVQESLSIPCVAHLAHIGISCGTPRVGDATSIFRTATLEDEQLRFLTGHLTRCLGRIGLNSKSETFRLALGSRPSGIGIATGFRAEGCGLPLAVLDSPNSRERIPRIRLPPPSASGSAQTPACISAQPDTPRSSPA